MEKFNPQNILNSANKDPIVRILLKYCNLTSTQYESLIIDYLSLNMSDIELTYKQKALLRSKSVSRVHLVVVYHKLGVMLSPLSTPYCF